MHNVGLRTGAGRTDVIELLRPGRPLLLLFGEEGSRYGEQARPWADVLRPVHADPTREVPCDALLVRPDGYVAWAAAAGGACLEDALALYFGSRSPRPAKQAVMAGVGALI